MIKLAGINHVKAVCDLVRQAIIYSCEADHQNDPEKLRLWLENKTVENFRRGLLNTHSRSWVALSDRQVVGVSQLGKDGYLHLCYVHPDAEGKGNGSSLLKQAEQCAREWGLKEVTLESTAAARQFYERHAYHQYTAPVDTWGMPGYQYRKILAE